MVSIKVRLCLDGGIFLGTLFCMAYAWTGKLLHEWIGMAVVVLFIAHLFINRRWYSKAFARKGVPMNGTRKTFNCLLVFMTLGMTVSSVLLSEYVFGFLGLGGNEVGLTPHLICSYWGCSSLLFAQCSKKCWQRLLKSAKRVSQMRGTLFYAFNQKNLKQ